jgi:aminoglycoside 6-adenylyltransferase
MLQSMTAPYQTILDQYLVWAKSREDIRAVLIVGSRARSDHPADEWADLDIITLTRDLPRYFGDPAWMAGFGEVWARTRHHTAGGEPEWLVAFRDGVDVDFVFQDARQTARHVSLFRWLARAPWLRRLLPRKTLAQIEMGRGMGAMTFGRGYRILIDKDNLLTRMVPLLGSPPPYQPPAESEFGARVEGYWLLVERCAKKIRRGEIAVARSWVDSLYWSALLPMIEWHTRASRGALVDTWHAGRFLEEWVDPRVRAALPLIFAPYDPRAIRSALFASMELFDWLTRETAQELGYAYPDQMPRQINGYVRELLATS